MPEANLFHLSGHQRQGTYLRDGTRRFAVACQGDPVVAVLPGKKPNRSRNFQCPC
jgi:hypothetical protein